MDQFSFSGFSASNMMACMADGADIYQTDYTGNRQLIGKTLSAYNELEQTTAKILDHVIQQPEKLPQIWKFMNYYLPTTLKLLNAYDRMGAAGVEGENIGGTMERIETMMETIVSSFHKQLDALFRDEAMDIASDITVMENLLAQEGLSDEGPTL